jgi:hypothetical protein
MPDKQREANKKLDANRRNALQSTGPRTPEGVEKCKLNSFRHGLRAVQIVVPGENPEDWEAHRNALVADLAPHGALEFALAEQVALKLWRLGRVVRYEADLIANAQAEDELFRAHEMSHQRKHTTPPKRSDIPTREDVANARQAAKKASNKVTELTKALAQLQTLAAMGDDDAYEDWTLFEVIRDEFRPNKNAVEQLFKGDVVSVFCGRHARALIRICLKDECELDQLQVQDKLAAFWTNQLDQLKRDAPNRQAEHESLARRYDEALERRRLASGLPDAKDLEVIQRYEAHLERGLHRDLDRLHQLKEARGAVPPRGPSVAVAVIQASPQQAPEETIAPMGSLAVEAPEGELAPIGSFDVEAPEGEMAPFGSFAVEAPEGEMAPFGSFHVEAAEMTEGPASVDAQG